MSDYADLIAKLEAAPEGSRELDALIWAEQDNRDVRWEGNRALAKSHRTPYDECLLGTIDPGEHGRWFDCDSYGHNPPIPRYSQSLDVALTLVPEGLRGFIKWDNFGGECVLTESSALCVADTSAATPALALCIAALKARTAVESQS